VGLTQRHLEHGDGAVGLLGLVKSDHLLVVHAIHMVAREDDY